MLAIDRRDAHQLADQAGARRIEQFGGDRLDQRIDAYIATLTPAQQIGQTLMLAVYANGYTTNLDQALAQWHPGSAIIFPNYNGGPLQPTTLAGLQQLVHDLKAHADTPLLLATDGYGNAQADEPWQPGVGRDLAELAACRDRHWFGREVPGWAERCASADGSGDDTTIALLLPGLALGTAEDG